VPAIEQQKSSVEKVGRKRADDVRNWRSFEPMTSQWTHKVKELITVTSIEPSVDGKSSNHGPNEPEKKAAKKYQLKFSPLLDNLHSKIRELVKRPVPLVQRLFIPRNKKHQHEWTEVEKLMILALLFHSQSLSLVDKFADVKVPNMRSSGGVFQYGSGLQG
jgi:hypothetical protein